MPPGPLTVTGTVPVPGGAVTVIWVPAAATTPEPCWADVMLKGEAMLLPNRTSVAPLKLEPLMVTWIPEGPEAGLMPLTTGADGGGGGGVVLPGAGVGAGAGLGTG